MLSFNVCFIINKFVIKKLDLGIGLPNMGVFRINALAFIEDDDYEFKTMMMMTMMIMMIVVVVIDVVIITVICIIVIVFINPSTASYGSLLQDKCLGFH